MKARFTVVVITRNRRQEVLHSLDRMTGLPEPPPIIVADNGSMDGTAEAVAAAYPEVDLVRIRRNLGATARNLAVRRIETPYVAFCDDDTWWDPGALTIAADLLDTHMGLAAVTGRVVVEPGLASPARRRRSDFTGSVVPVVQSRPGQHVAGSVGRSPMLRDLHDLPCWAHRGRTPAGRVGMDRVGGLVSLRDQG